MGRGHVDLDGDLRAVLLWYCLTLFFGRVKKKLNFFILN